MAKKVAKKSESMQSALQSLGRQIYLQDIRLVACSSAQAVKEGPLPTQLETDIAIEVRVDKERTFIKVRPTIVMRLRYEDAAKDDAPSVNVMAQYQITYLGIKKIGPTPKETLEQFGQTVALFNVWPYWREFIQSTLMRMGLPAITLPLLGPGGIQGAPDQMWKSLSESKVALKKKSK